MHTMWISKSRGPAQPCSKKVLALTKEDQGERYVKMLCTTKYYELGSITMLCSGRPTRVIYSLWLRSKTAI